MHIYRAFSTATSLSSTVAKTMFQIVTPSTRKVKLLEFGVSFSSVTSTDGPVVAEFLVNSGAGTASAMTPIAIDLGDPASLCTGCQNIFTVEPTGTTAAGPGPITCTPVGGLFVYPFAQGVELVVPVSTKLGFRLTAPSALSNVYAYAIFQE
jgi:hypothetical protein